MAASANRGQARRSLEAATAGMAEATHPYAPYRPWNLYNGMPRPYGYGYAQRYPQYGWPSPGRSYPHDVYGGQSNYGGPPTWRTNRAPSTRQWDLRSYYYGYDAPYAGPWQGR